MNDEGLCADNAVQAFSPIVTTWNLRLRIATFDAAGGLAATPNGPGF